MNFSQFKSFIKKRFYSQLLTDESLEVEMLENGVCLPEQSEDITLLVSMVSALAQNDMLIFTKLKNKYPIFDDNTWLTAKPLDRLKYFNTYNILEHKDEFLNILNDKYLNYYKLFFDIASSNDHYYFSVREYIEEDNKLLYIYSGYYHNNKLVQNRHCIESLYYDGIEHMLKEADNIIVYYSEYTQFIKYLNELYLLNTNINKLTIIITKYSITKNVECFFLNLAKLEKKHNKKYNICLIDDDMLKYDHPSQSVYLIADFIKSAFSPDKDQMELILRVFQNSLLVIHELIQ